MAIFFWQRTSRYRHSFDSSISNQRRRLGAACNGGIYDLRRLSTVDRSTAQHLHGFCASVGQRMESVCQFHRLPEQKHRSTHTGYFCSGQSDRHIGVRLPSITLDQTTERYNVSQVRVGVVWRYGNQIPAWRHSWQQWRPSRLDK